MAFLNKHFPRVNAMANTLYRALRLYHSNCSLRALGVLFSHLRHNILNEAVPAFITIASTYRCQCCCVHCYAKASERDHRNELEMWQFKSVIDQAKQLGALYITFSGGEPLLREDTVELVEHAHDKGLLTRINTNGLLLDREHVSKLKKAGLTQCGVSIDDADPHTHDRLRGVAGAHKKVLQGIKNLREFNIPCQILVYASKRNVTSGLEKVIDLGKQLGVLSVYILFPVAIGRWDGAFEQLLTKEEKARVRELQDLTFVHVEIPTSRAMCAVFAKSVLFVSPQGDVTPCPFIPYVIGNIKNHTLEELWHCYSAKLSGGYRGDCVLNSTEHREVLQRHVESVARTLRRSPS